MLSTYKNPDVSSIRIFFPFLWSLFSCQAHRKALTEWNRSPMVALRSKLYKQEKTNSQNQAFSSFLICSAAAAETQAYTWGKRFSCFSQGPACVTWGLLRVGKGGHEGGSHLADPSCKMSGWWLLIDPEPACAGGDKVVFVAHLPVARASLSLLQTGGDTASEGAGGGWGGKRPCAKEFPLLSD